MAWKAAMDLVKAPCLPLHVLLLGRPAAGGGECGEAACCWCRVNRPVPVADSNYVAAAAAAGDRPGTKTSMVS